jgi:hypothetical protein
VEVAAVVVPAADASVAPLREAEHAGVEVAEVQPDAAKPHGVAQPPAAVSPAAV